MEGNTTESTILVAFFLCPRPAKGAVVFWLTGGRGQPTSFFEYLMTKKTEES